LHKGEDVMSIPMKCPKCGSDDLEFHDFKCEDIKEKGYDCNSCDYSWLIDINNEEEVKEWYLNLDNAISNMPSYSEELNKSSRTMNIYANPGDKIVFYYPNNGLSKDKENAKKYLKQGEIYTVDHTVVYSESTKVFLVEFPGVIFNSVQFKDLEH
jgi:hypothetical protein